MMFCRLKALLVAGLALAAAAISTPSPGNAAPVSAGLPSALAGAGEGLVAQAGWRHGHYRHARYFPRRHYRRAHFRRAYYRPYRPYRHYRPARFYRPVYVRPRYYRPVRYVRPVRCRIVYQTFWNGWGWVSGPVRVCRRW